MTNNLLQGLNCEKVRISVSIFEENNIYSISTESNIN